jgi:hypothetical protein
VLVLEIGITSNCGTDRALFAAENVDSSRTKDDDEAKFGNFERMGRDSNPRYLAVHTLSRRAQSTTLAPIQLEPETLERQVGSFN